MGDGGPLQIARFLVASRHLFWSHTRDVGHALCGGAQLQPHGIRSQRTLVTTPGDAEQSTRRQRQDVIPSESQQASSSSCAATDT